MTGGVASAGRTPRRAWGRRSPGSGPAGERVRRVRINRLAVPGAGHQDRARKRGQEPWTYVVEGTEAQARPGECRRWCAEKRRQGQHEAMGPERRRGHDGRDPAGGQAPPAAHEEDRGDGGERDGDEDGRRQKPGDRGTVEDREGILRL